MWLNVAHNTGEKVKSKEFLPVALFLQFYTGLKYSESDLKFSNRLQISFFWGNNERSANNTFCCKITFRVQIIMSRVFSDEISKVAI